jgi:hypothetical protein
LGGFPGGYHLKTTNKAQDKIKKVLDKKLEAEVTISIVYLFKGDELSKEVRTPIRLEKDDSIHLTFNGVTIS